MKTIKVIDLFILLANKECDKLPKKIKRCDNKIFHLAIFNNGEFYKYENDTEDLEICACSISLNEEFEIIEEPILDEKEREYLSAVTKPFRNRILYICKDIFEDEYITITLKENNTAINYYLPPFKKNTMYKGMEIRKKYSLEELGL